MGFRDALNRSSTMCLVLSSGTMMLWVRRVPATQLLLSGIAEYEDPHGNARTVLPGRTLAAEVTHDVEPDKRAINAADAERRREHQKERDAQVPRTRAQLVRTVSKYSEYACAAIVGGAELVEPAEPGPCEYVDPSEFDGYEACRFVVDEAEQDQHATPPRYWIGHLPDADVGAVVAAGKGVEDRMPLLRHFRAERRPVGRSEQDRSDVGVEPVAGTG